MSRGILGLAFFTIAFVVLVLAFRVEDGGTGTASSQPRAGERAGPAVATAATQAVMIRTATATPEGETAEAPEAAVRLPAELFVTTDALNIRAAPGSGRVVARAGKGDEVRVVEVTDGWARLASDGGEPRWAAAKYLSRQRPPVEHYVSAGELNVRAAPGTGAVIERIGYRHRVTVYAIEDGWARLTPEDAEPRFAAAKYLSRERPPARYYVKADKLNIRAAPRTGKVLDLARRGEELAVYAVRDGWGRLTREPENARWAAMEHLSESR